MTEVADRLPKLFKASKGTQGSIHYACGTFLDRPSAEASAEKMAGAWAAHPAATPCVLSCVEEESLTSAESRTIRACLRSESGWITLGKDVRVKDSRLHRLFELELLAGEEVVEQEQIGSSRWRERRSVRVRLTSKGLAWVKGCAL